jgi:hypothetical protein
MSYQAKVIFVMPVCELNLVAFVIFFLYNRTELIRSSLKIRLQGSSGRMNFHFFRRTE